MKKAIISVLLLIAPGIIRADEFTSLLESVARRNLTLKEEREVIKATGYELKEQNTLDNTAVEYSPFFRKGAAGVASSELIVSQELDFPTLYVARGKAAKKQLNVSEQQYFLKCRDILLEAAETYINIVRLNRIQELLGKQLKDTENLLVLFQKRYDAGDATSIDINRIKIRLMELKRDLLSNESEIVSDKSIITNLNGYEPFDCKAEDYPAWTFSESLSYSPDYDAEVKAGESEVESLRQAEKVARQGWVPKLTLGYRRNTELDEASNGFIVGASFPLFTTSSKVKAAKAMKAAAEIGMENIKLKVSSELETTRNALNLISRSLSEYDVRLLDETEQLLKKSVELGNMTLTDYYIESDALNERKLSYIDLEYEYYRRLSVLYKNTLIQKGND